MMPIVAFLRELRPMTVILGVMVGVVLVIALWQGVTIASLEDKLGTCKLEKKALLADVAIHDAKITELLSAIADQNAEMKRLDRSTAALQEAANRAEITLAQAKAQHLRELADLSKAEGSSCEDGIALIDRELKL